MNRIAIFASGTGTNAKKIIDHFDDFKEVEVAIILSNKPKAKVLTIAKDHNIPIKIINRTEFYHSDVILDVLNEEKIDLVVLAGFLWLIPENLIKNYTGKIVNIHPALLPKYGGKGMYGMNVHQAVYDRKEKESGISIHYVNENYDEGQIIFQAHCLIDENDQPKDIAKKIQKLEHKYYPFIVEKILSQADNN